MGKVIKAAEDFDAITLDTSIFRKYNLQFDEGLLKRVSLFKDLGKKVIISDVIYNEVVKHVAEQIEATLTDYEKLSRSLKYTKYLIGTIFENTICDLEKSKINVIKIARKRVDSYISNSKIIVINASKNVNVEQIMDRYFSNRPPFRDNGKKKNEFPDAIALESIVNWANTNNATVVAVSEDGDWEQYANELNSDKFVLLKELATIFDVVKDDIRATEVIERFKKEYDESVTLQKSLFEFLADLVTMIDVDVDYYSDFDIEHEDTETKLLDHALCRNSNDEIIIKMIENTSETMEVVVRVNLKYSVSASFSISVWDSVDHDSVYLDNGHGYAEDEIETSVLLTVNLNSENPVNIVKVELLETSRLYVKLGEINPDFYYDAT